MLALAYSVWEVAQATLPKTCWSKVTLSPLKTFASHPVLDQAYAEDATCDYRITAKGSFEGGALKKIQNLILQAASLPEQEDPNTFSLSRI